MEGSQNLDVGGGHWLRWIEAGIGPDTRAVVLLLQGRSEFLEKYREVIERLAARGLGVIAFDWRGQGLSSRPLANPHKGHIEDFETYLADLDRLIETVIRRRWDCKVILIAHSMGGNVAMRCLVRRPQDFSSAIFVSPMWELPLGRLGRLAARSLAGLGAGLGLGTAYAPGRRDYDPAGDRFEGNKLTTDRARFYHARQLRIDNPDLRLGGPTIGWLRACLASIRALESEVAAAPPDLPVTILSGADDTVVDLDSHQRIADRLAQGRRVAFQGGLHELLMERDEILELVYAEIGRRMERDQSGGRRPA